MQTSRLTSTLRRASCRDPAARLVDTTAGQQLRRDADGDRQREQQRVDHRPVQRDVDDEDRARSARRRPRRAASRTCAARPGTRSRAGCCPRPGGDPAELGVGRRWRPRRRCPMPACTTVPISAQLVSSASGVPGGDRRRRTSPTGQRLAGQHRLVALQPGDGQQPQVGRDHLAQLQVDHVAGHQLGHVDRARVPVAQHHAAVADLECSASAVFAALYSLTNPRPTEAARITPMITASLRWPTKHDASAAPSSSPSSGERSWCQSTASAAPGARTRRWGRTAPAAAPPRHRTNRPRRVPPAHAAASGPDRAAAASAPPPG